MATHISANFVAFDVLCFPILFCGFTVQCTLYVVTFKKTLFVPRVPYSLYSVQGFILY